MYADAEPEDETDGSSVAPPAEPQVADGNTLRHSAGPTDAGPEVITHRNHECGSCGKLGGESRRMTMNNQASYGMSSREARRPTVRHRPAAQHGPRNQSGRIPHWQLEGQV